MKNYLKKFEANQLTNKQKEQLKGGRKRPGRKKFGNITLKKGYIDDVEVTGS